MLGAAKYIYVKDGIDARRATLVTLFGFLVMTPVWIVPAMGATILHPNLAAEFPKLANPHDAAYVAMALHLLPHGLLGVLVSAIFAASVAYMTYLISLGSGIFVRNFYIRVVNKDASEKRQIAVGRIFTAGGPNAPAHRHHRAPHGPRQALPVRGQGRVLGPDRGLLDRLPHEGIFSCGSHAERDRLELAARHRGAFGQREPVPLGQVRAAASQQRTPGARLAIVA